MKMKSLLLCGALLATAACGTPDTNSLSQERPGSTSGEATASAEPTGKPSLRPGQVWDDRLRDFSSSVEGDRLTRLVAVRDDLVMGVATSEPKTDAESALAAFQREGGAIFGAAQAKPTVVFCTLSTDSYGTINEDNTVTRKYQDTPVWAFVYHDVMEEGRGGYINEDPAKYQGGNLVHANLVGFMDDASNSFIFTVDDSIVHGERLSSPDSSPGSKFGQKG